MEIKRYFPVIFFPSNCFPFDNFAYTPELVPADALPNTMVNAFWSLTLYSVPGLSRSGQSDETLQPEQPVSAKEERRWFIEHLARFVCAGGNSNVKPAAGSCREGAFARFTNVCTEAGCARRQMVSTADRESDTVNGALRHRMGDLGTTASGDR